MSDVKVFVSYSWGVESDTGIVDEIEALCPPRSIELVRDCNAMQHGDVIMDFMDKLTSGDHIITVFSKPYFKSPWCMYELLKIWQKGDFQQRTHALFADDCDLQDMAYRIGIVKHWLAEHDKIKDLLDGVDPALLGKEYERANMIRDIGQNASDLVNFAAGRLTTPLVDLRAQQYAQVLDKISLPPAVGLAQEALPSPQISAADWKKLDEEFMASVRKGVETKLKSSPLFLEKLGDHYEQSDAKLLADKLIEQCKQGEFRRVIQYLEASLDEACDLLDENRALLRLLDAADSVAAHLVLFNVKDSWLAQNYQSFLSDGSYKLPELQLESANVAVSRLLGGVPYYKNHAESVQSVRSIGSGIELESGIKKESTVSLVLKLIASTLWPDQETFSSDNDELAKKIRSKLEYYRTHVKPSMRRRHFVRVPEKEANSLVCTELQRLLPMLAWITVDLNGQKDVFVVDDMDLKTDIETFYEALEGRR
uniref:TIR domain-containing protein n=1 Tax=uncultured Thiotrichaceae bacterium TaxID=298394 RepID=A0A6S6TIA6_9GAMM|nr:MAG: Unknown protein [uncultured Thiotrichaceae bacterium]